MGKCDMPDRWDLFSAFKRRVRGTCILAHKTPLQSSYGRDLSPTELVSQCKEFTRLGVSHVKIPCPHDRIPSPESVSKFKEHITNFITAHPKPGAVVGVHCKYGVNQAGYMIARYLTECLEWSVEEAIDEIELARGHTMERINLINDLLSRNKNRSRKRKKLYRSTLGGLTGAGGGDGSSPPPAHHHHDGTGRKCFAHHHHHSHLEEVMFS